MAVVGEKQLLQRRLPAEQPRHPSVRQRGQQRLDRPGHLAAQRAPLGHHAAHAGNPRQVGGFPAERRLDGDRRQVPQLAQCPCLSDPPAAQDHYPVAQRLDLAQHVGGQEDGLAAPARLGDALPEHRLHQRIEPAGRLVEDEEFRACHQCGNEQDLLAVAPGVGAHLLGRVEIEPGDQLVPVRLVRPAVQSAEKVQGLGPGQRRPQAGLSGHERHPAMHRGRVPLAVRPEDLRPPRRRPDEAQQQPDRRGLARPVRPQVTDYLTGPDVQVEAG